MANTIRDRVVRALDEKMISATDLAKRAKVSYSVIVNLKRREKSSTAGENAIRLMRVLDELEGVTADITRVDDSDEFEVNGTLIPVYDVQASAGFGSLVDYEEQTHSLAFPPDYLRKLTAGSPKSLVIISTKGDSMEPTLLDDDIVLVDTSKTHMGYEGMFVLRHNDTLLVKRAGMAPKPGHVMLISDNKAYPPVEARLEDLHVVGKVLWYGRKV